MEALSTKKEQIKQEEKYFLSVAGLNEVPKENIEVIENLYRVKAVEVIEVNTKIAEDG